MTPVELLRPLLSTDWRPATEVMREAEALGLSSDQVRAARKRLGVSREMGAVSRRDGHWWWRLPGYTCPTCGAPWAGRWPLEGPGGDYWATDHAPSHAMAEDRPVTPPEPEPPTPVMRVPPAVPLEPDGPPRCDRCGMAAAADRGMACPYWPAGRKCGGTLR
jgi:hypothetical protein